MKNILIPTVLALMLTACGDKPPTDTVESLIANPERLKELRAQCKADRAKVGDATCNAVGEATTRRFLGEGKVPYNPPASQPAFEVPQKEATKDTTP
jgi:hypothetical protein